jgi:hypothetical protein
MNNAMVEDSKHFAQFGTDERAIVVRDVYLAFNLTDNGGRRSGIERRRFSYSGHIPERRSGVDRRCLRDRRDGERHMAKQDRYGEQNRRLSDQRQEMAL